MAKDGVSHLLLQGSEGSATRLLLRGRQPQRRGPTLQRRLPLRQRHTPADIDGSGFVGLYSHWHPCIEILPQLG
jgi:hypothetical protein